MTSKPKYYAEEIVDAVNHGQPDAYAVLRHSETHQLCLIYMGRFLPLAHFEMDFQREGGEPLRRPQTLCSGNWFFTPIRIYQQVLASHF